MNAPAPSPLSPDLLARFAALVGPSYAITDTADMHAFMVEPRDRYLGRAAMVLRPGTTEEVAAIVKLAAATGTPIVPQGGNTGMVGGQIPDESRRQLLLSLGRLNRVREIDAEANTLTAEAGVTLAAVQQAADGAGRLFPLSLGSEGSCEIGGNISSNAGGTAVLAYGNTRDLVLGLEVVLPSGEIWNGLRKLRKDNTGYDLKQLFIGAEGTLGVITAAVLKLFAKPKGQSLALAGVASPEAALRLYTIAREGAASALTACEFMPRIGIDFLLRHGHGIRDPLASTHDWYVLLEISSPHSDDDAARLMEAILVSALEAGVVDDVVRAESLQQASDFWRMRHSLSDIQKAEGGSIKHDVAVPVAVLPAFLREASALVQKLVPGCRPFPFGHLGDGNVHFNVSQPVGMDKAAYLSRWEEMNEAVYALVHSFGGTFSAEHGIGRLKRETLARVKSPVEMALMRSIKAAIDPAGILNPGKLL